MTTCTHCLDTKKEVGVYKSNECQFCKPNEVAEPESKEARKAAMVLLVDGAGVLKFQSHYKETLTYKNDKYEIQVIPEFRTESEAEETLEDILIDDDTRSIQVRDLALTTDNLIYNE